MAKDTPSLKINSKNSPVGVFQFCAVTGAGIKNTKASTRKNEVFEYKASLEIDIEDAQDLLDQIDDFLEDNKIKGCNLTGVPYQTHDDYDGVPKGKVWLIAKAKTKWEDNDGDEQDTKISIYDTTGQKCDLPEGEGIGKGSEGSIFGKIVLWDRDDEYGATLWLSGIQITEYIPYVFEEAPEVKKGSFKGFDNKKSDLEKQEDDEDSQPSRRSSRDRTESKDDEDARPSRRSSRDRTNNRSSR